MSDGHESQAAYVVEPELAAPVPRSVRPRVRERFVRWLFYTMAYIAPGAMIVGAVLIQRTHSALHDAGREVEGRVAEKIPAKKDSGPGIALSYQVDGRSYRLQEGRTAEEYMAIKLDDVVPIVYLPDDPSTAKSRHVMNRDGDTASGSQALYIVAGILALIAWPCWFYLARKMRLLRELGRDGTPLAADVTSIESYGNRSHDHWRVRYEFTLAGESRQGKTYVFGDDVTAIEAAGRRATVLYDPIDPSRYDLYRAVKRLYTVS